MEKALEATKDLARNCRENGTAWRLGVRFFSFQLFWRLFCVNS